jgi:hypothetical protein
MWANFPRHLFIEVQADRISFPLKATYVPSTPEEIELDWLHSLYIAFLSSIMRFFLIIRKHMPTFNARASSTVMVHHMTASTKAHHKWQKIMKCLVSFKMKKNTKTTATHFILLVFKKNLDNWMKHLLSLKNN